MLQSHEATRMFWMPRTACRSKRLQRPVAHTSRGAMESYIACMLRLRAYGACCCEHRVCMLVACGRRLEQVCSTPPSYQSQSTARGAVEGHMSHTCHARWKKGMDGGSTKQSMCLLANRRCELVTDPTHDPTPGRYQRPGQRLLTCQRLVTAGSSG